MKFHIFGLLLLVPAFGQFQFAKQIAGSIKNAVSTSVNAVENVAKDGIKQVQQFGRNIGTTVENAFSPPQPQPTIIPVLIVNQVQNKILVKPQISIQKPEQQAIKKPSNSQAQMKLPKRPFNDRKMHKKQSLSDSQSQSESQSQSQDQYERRNIEVKLCGQGNSNGYGAFIRSVKLLKITESPAKIEHNFIKNSDFKLNACKDSYCIYNKKTYSNSVKNWQADPELQIGNGNLYSNKLNQQRVIELDANQNTCIKQIVPKLQSGKYKLEVSYGARQGTALTTDNSFNIKFNGIILKNVIPTDYELHTQILQVSIEKQKQEQAQNNHEKRKKCHGHQKFNPQTRMKKCQQKLQKIISQFKKIQQQHKKQGKQLNKKIIQQNQQQIKRLNQKMQRIIKNQNKFNKKQRPQRVRIERQIDIKAKGNVQHTIVHQKIQITNKQVQGQGQQNFRDRKRNGNKQFNNNENNKRMKQLMRQRRNPYENHGGLKRSIGNNEFVQQTEGKIERAPKVINDQNIMSGKRHVREQMMQNQKTKNSDIKDLNEQKQIDNNAELIILN